MIMTDTPGTAFNKISMDIVRKLPITSSQKQYILNIKDNFTKYSLAIPLPNHQAGTIADAFVKQFICIYDSPKAVSRDQGADLSSNLMRKMAKRFRIRQFKTTANLKKYLKEFIKNNAEWDDWIELAMFSYNTSVHEGIKCTPYELIFGKKIFISDTKFKTKFIPEYEKMETYYK